MPTFTYNHFPTLSLNERITTPSLCLSKDNEHWYVPLFEGDNKSVVRKDGYKYVLGGFKVGDLRAAIINRGEIIDEFSAVECVAAYDNYGWIESTTWVLTPNGGLYACGSNDYVQQGTNEFILFPLFAKRAENVKKFCCSYWATWYIDTDNNLYGCGFNYSGEQGSGEKEEEVSAFTKRAENVKDVKCSIHEAGATTWYLTNDNELYGCGYNGYGQQGNGEYGSGSEVLTFTKRAENVKEFSCSSHTTWYLTNNNELYGCGYANAGQQGADISVRCPVFIKRAENVKQFSCSRHTTWYVANDGTLYGCGSASYGQQSSGNTKRVTRFIKRAENVKEVKCTDKTTWYLTNDGKLYGCGFNENGNQGSGDTTNVQTFTKRAENVKDFMCLDDSTWYIDNNNDLYGCGYNNYGNFGLGNTENILTFTKIAENVKEFSCSGVTTWYIDFNNNLYGCGWNGDGNLGNGDFYAPEDYGSGVSRNDFIVPTFTKMDA